MENKPQLISSEMSNKCFHTVTDKTWKMIKKKLKMTKKLWKSAKKNTKTGFSENSWEPKPTTWWKKCDHKVKKTTKNIHIDKNKRETNQEQSEKDQTASVYRAECWCLCYCDPGGPLYHNPPVKVLAVGSILHLMVIPALCGYNQLMSKRPTTELIS